MIQSKNVQPGPHKMRTCNRKFFIIHRNVIDILCEQLRSYESFHEMKFFKLYLKERDEKDFCFAQIESSYMYL